MLDPGKSATRFSTKYFIRSHVSWSYDAMPVCGSVDHPKVPMRWSRSLEVAERRFFFGSRKCQPVENNSAWEPLLILRHRRIDLVAPRRDAARHVADILKTVGFH